MKIVNVVQGTPEWLDLRANRFCGSEAAAMLGQSKFMTRDELLRLKKFGEQPKEIDPYAQRIGRESEEYTRSVVEDMICTELFPSTGIETVEGMPFLSSYDGLSLDFKAAWENKAYNKEIVNCIEKYVDVPDYIWPQLEHNMLTAGLDRIMFTTAGVRQEEYVELVYTSKPDRRKRILDGWRLFQKDLESYQKRKEIVEIRSGAKSVVPAVRASITATVTDSNVKDFAEAASAFLAGIKSDLNTDEDFARADGDIKTCKKIESAVKTAVEGIKEQSKELSGLFDDLEGSGEFARKKRLSLEKPLKSRKTQIKRELILKGLGVFRDKFDDQWPESIPKDFEVSFDPDLDYAIKGLKTLKSCQDAIDSAVTQALLKAVEDLPVRYAIHQKEQEEIKQRILEEERQRQERAAEKEASAPVVPASKAGLAPSKTKNPAADSCEDERSRRVEKAIMDLAFAGFTYEEVIQAAQKVRKSGVNF